MPRRHRSAARRLFGAGAILALALHWTTGSQADETRTINVVDVTGRGIGTSQIEADIVSECIAMLPSEAQLAPVVEAKSAFLKNIGGDVERNESVRTFHATVDVSYVIHQRQLVVVTMNTVEKSEPLIKEVDRRFDREIRFESNPENGDQWSGRELVKEFYFSTPEAAVDDAMRRARAWLASKRSVMCEK